MSRTAYITRSSVCLPNQPVENDQVEAILGQIGQTPSRARRLVQRSNGIRRRYYVIDPKTGLPNYLPQPLSED
jgi:3-oxoacyl-[acyl-carrier-protein] synthase III